MLSAHGSSVHGRACQNSDSDDNLIQTRDNLLANLAKLLARGASVTFDNAASRSWNVLNISVMFR